MNQPQPGPVWVSKVKDLDADACDGSNESAANAK
jgi:hypothetical protein